MSNYAKSSATKLDVYNSPICYIMAICPFFMGLLLEYQIAMAMIVVFIILIAIIVARNELHFRLNPGVYFGLAMVLLSVVSVFTGIVKGEAIYGMLRVLAAGIWVILLMQISDDEKKLALGIIPNVAVVMTVISALAFVTGISSTLLFEEERMAGFLGYSNTFSLYLLIALVVFSYECKEDKNAIGLKNIKDVKKSRSVVLGLLKHYLYPVVILVGILWSGSRTTFVMTVGVLIFLAIFNKNVRVFYILMLVFGVVGAILFVLITGSTEAIGRFLTISTTSSTLLGRILYWKDGLSELIRYPFGMGYESFYFAQGEFQTGVYETLYVHNDWLQIAIDFGILFFVSFLALFIYQLIKTKGLFRFVIIIIGLHMIMDFDIQFIIITWILLLCMKWDIGKEKVLSFDRSSKKLVACLSLTIIALVYGWIGMASFFYSIGEYKISSLIYPFGLRNQEMYLISSKTAEEYEKRAIDVLWLYDKDAPALDVMALCAAERKEYLDVLDYKKKSLQVQKYRTEVYDDFVMMMDEGATVYKEAGDDESYRKCVDALLDTENMLKYVEETTDPLAYIIYDKPNFNLSDKSKDIISKYK